MTATNSTGTVKTSKDLVVSVPTSEKITAGTKETISGVSVSDAWAAGNPGEMALNVWDNSGTLTIDGKTFGPGGGPVPGGMLTGSLAQINADLATLAYTAGAATGTDTITVDVWNQAGVEVKETIAVAITPSPTDLVVSVPTSEKITAGAKETISGVSVNDAWAAGNTGNMALNVWDNSGTLTIDGKTFGPGGGPVAGGMLTGSLAQINADLATLSYTAGKSTGTDTITVDVWNQAGVEVKETIAVAVTPSPTDLAVAVPASETVTAGATEAISGVSVSDAWAAANAGNMALNVWDNSGTLTIDGKTFGPGGGPVAFGMLSGSLAQINADLATLAYTAGAATGTDTITVDVWNQAGVEVKETVGVAVTPSPTDLAVDPPAKETVTVGTTTLITGISITDAWAASHHGNMTVQVVDDAGDGTLSAPGYSAASSLTFTGTLAQVNADLAALSFTATAVGSDGITVEAQNQAGVEVKHTIAVAVTPSPTDLAVAVPASETVTAGTKQAISGVSVSDAWAAANPGNMALDVWDNSGTLTIGGKTFGPGGGAVTGGMLSGSLAQINADLATLAYTAGTATGTDTITVEVLNQAGVAVTHTIAVAVTPSPTDLAVAVPASETVTAGTKQAISGVSVSDAWAAANPGNMALDVWDNSGTLTIGGKTFGPGGGAVTGGMLTGTLAQINADLATLAYTAGTATGTDTITVEVLNQAGVAVTHTIAVAVTPSSTDLAVTVPASETVTAGTKQAISGVSVSDAWAAANPGNMALDVWDNSGTLTIGGKTFGPGGGAVTGGMLTGTLAQINADLATLAYTAGTSTGTDTITVEVLNQAGVAVTHTIAVSVTPAPTDLAVTVPASETVTAGTKQAISGVSVSDAWAAANPGNMALDVWDNSGTLTIGGKTFGPGGGAVTGGMLTGTLAQINADLATLAYTAGTATGTDTITVEVLNQAGVAVTHTIAVAVTPSPTDLAVAVPASETVTAGATEAISGVSVSDAWAVANPGNMALDVWDNSGTLTIGGKTFGPGGGAVTGGMLTGTLAQINADLATLAYTAGTATGTDTITVEVLNQAGVAVTHTIAVAVTPAPTDLAVTVPASETVTAGAKEAISGVSVSDAWAAANPGNMQLDVWDNSGTLTIGGKTFGPGGGAVTGGMLTGTLAQINADLATLAYTAGTATGTDTITVEVLNQAGVAVTHTIAVAVTPAPTDLAVTVPASETVTAGATEAISGVSVSDAWAAANPGNMQLDVWDNSGTLTIGGKTFGPGGGAVTGGMLTGTLAQINADLATLAYTAGTATGTDTITVEVLNQAGVEVTHTIAVAVTPSPTDLAVDPPAKESVTVGTTTLIAGIAIVDAWAASQPGNMTVQVVDDAGDGTLSAPGHSAASSLSFTGTLTQVNADLAAVSFTATAAGSDAITVEAWNQAGVEKTTQVPVTIVAPPPPASTATFSDNFATTPLSLWNGSSGTWQPSYSWSPNGYIASDATSWLVNPSYGPTSAPDDDPYKIVNGVLQMNVLPRPADVSSSSVGGASYLSGMLTTKPSFSQEYGYFEIDAKMSSAPGTMSAFWLLPTSGAWPPEIDIAEVLANDPTMLATTSHSVTTSQQQALTTVANMTDSFNTYALNWTSSTITWYFNGQQVYQIATPSNMNQPMYILLDTMAGASGSWEGAPTGAGMPSGMDVGWVQTYASMAAATAAGATAVTSSTATAIAAPGTTTGTSSTPPPSNIFTIASNVSNPVENVSNATISAVAGGQIIFIGGTGDTLTAVGGGYTVQAAQGGNTIITAGGGNTITVAASGNTINAGTGNNTITDSGSGNSIILPAAGLGDDTIYGSVFQNGDTMNLSQILAATNWNGQASILSEYLVMTTSSNGANAVLEARNTPTGSLSPVATFEGSGAVSLSTLLAHAVT